jgi:DNA-binding response OmpR family regulator
MDQVRTILIADDEPHLRLLAKTALASDGFRIVEAQDGENAWDLLLQERPALASLDIHMPGKNGVELTREIKHDARLAGTRVILLTGSLEEVYEGLSAGADLYLSKPFSPMEFQAAVHRLLAA